MRQSTVNAINSISFPPLRWFMNQVMGAVDIILDEVYDRFDLWSNKTLHIADFSKVRSFMLYMAAIFTIIFVTTYSLIHSKSLPIAFLEISIGFLITAAFGERTLIAFIKAWGGKGLDSNVSITTPEQLLEKVASGVRPPTPKDI